MQLLTRDQSFVRVGAFLTAVSTINGRAKPTVPKASDLDTCQSATASGPSPYK